MQVAVVGGGINGLCTAWKLAQANHDVTLYERDRLMNATSAASSKLLHGGLRYLETGQIGLVRRSLRERDAWLTRVPQFTRPLPILLPIFHTSRRPRWQIGLGLRLYDLLAGKSALPRSTWLNSESVWQLAPDLKHEGLVGAYRYYDAQMDDRAVGMWVADQCRNAGVSIKEHAPVVTVSEDGWLTAADGKAEAFERILNITGPWADELLADSNVLSSRHIDHVRGSHLIVARRCVHALILEVPNERRIFFVLPWQEHTLVGTTEVRQRLDQPIACSDAEVDYLLRAYNDYHNEPIGRPDIIDSFAGVRPLIRSASSPTESSRDYVIQKNGRLITVFGGKWTTAMALAEKLTCTLH
jgi:glycerol-3-phosphate dehydrogenase